MHKPLLACDDNVMPPKIARVSKPYKEEGGKLYRLVVFEEGARKSVFCHSLEEAEKTRERLLQLFSDRSTLTIVQAVAEFCEEKREQDMAATSILSARGKLLPFLPEDAALSAITPERAQRLYLEETKREGRFGVVQAATHQKVLRRCKEFFNWAVFRKYVEVNPFAGVKAIGRARAGKPQLRLDEAHRLWDLCYERAEAGDEGALAVLVQIAMALRSGEVLRLKTRDLDAGGTMLVVDGTKTKNSRRSLPIEHEGLRTLLLRHSKGRAPESLMFGEGRTKPFQSDKLYKTLRKLCRDDGVPLVCPHSLRGLHSSLAVANGASIKHVAEALGHASTEITRKHYIAKGTVERVSTRRMAEMLGSKPQHSSDAASAAKMLLEQLDPATLAELATLIQQRAN